MNDRDLGLKDLEQFRGTEHYYQAWLSTLATDGIKYIMDNGYSWFVTDAISVIKTTQKLKNEEFLVIKLKLLKDGGAKMVIDDGNDNILYEQKYEWTDAKREIVLFFQNNVIFLSGEY